MVHSRTVADKCIVTACPSGTPSGFQDQKPSPIPTSFKSESGSRAVEKATRVLYSSGKKDIESAQTSKSVFSGSLQVDAVSHDEARGGPFCRKLNVKSPVDY